MRQLSLHKLSCARHPIQTNGNLLMFVFPNRTSPKETDADSCQHLSRKKRRGVIEKKRRDRINSSLSELKRLVPSAYEKQGSSKLEKAEILQLTVDHLKSLHSKGTCLRCFNPLVKRKERKRLHQFANEQV